MPKVSEDYLEERRQFIIECALKVYEGQTLYRMTMRDIIRETGFSQGNIYRYFKSVPELLIAAANTKQQPFGEQDQIPEILGSNLLLDEKVKCVFNIIGHYIQQVIEEIGAKMYYELSYQLSMDLDLWKEIGAQLYFKVVMGEMIRYIVAYLEGELCFGRIQPKEKLNTIVQYAAIVVDGIANQVALQKMNRIEEVNIDQMMRLLAESVVQMLSMKGEE
ncbi:MAG: TetR/AcrR family transcriptional regulator [Cellulosilyticaceae bacterium]